MYKLVDFKTRAPVEPGNFVFTGAEGPWEVVMDLDRVRSKVNVEYFKKSPPLISKYLPLMPIKDYRDFEGDSLSGLLSVLSKLPPGEAVFIQLVVRSK